MKVVIVKSDNSIEVKEIESLDNMQEIVGGYIETVYPRQAYKECLLNSGNCFVCDEEGLLKRKPINIIGTALYNGLSKLDSDIHPIVGDIFICGYDYEDLRGLTKDEVDFYISKFNEILGGLK